MTKKLLQLIGLSLAITIAVSFAVTWFISQQKFQESTFATSPMGTERPSDLGVEFELISIRVNDRLLKAWFIAADNPVAAVLVFHGQRESLSNWIFAVERFHDANLSVLVFDYSGFGDSQGTPSVANLREDAKAAYEEFRKRTSGLPVYLLGYSLGTGVLLDAINHHDITGNAIVLASPFSSIRDIAVYEGSMPRVLAFLLPDAYDNEKYVKPIELPLHIVHSETDGRFPVWMAKKVADAAPGGKLVVVDGPAHSDFLASKKDIGDSGDEFWAAVLAVLK